MKCLLIISLFFSCVAHAQELTPVQIGAITKADSLAVVALNNVLKNAIYSLNSALGKSNAVSIAKDRAQDSINNLRNKLNVAKNKTQDSLLAIHGKSIVSVNAKSTAQTGINKVQTSINTSSSAKDQAQDKLIATLQTLIATHTSLIAALQKKDIILDNLIATVKQIAQAAQAAADKKSSIISGKVGQISIVEISPGNFILSTPLTETRLKRMELQKAP